MPGYAAATTNTAATVPPGICFQMGGSAERQNVAGGNPEIGVPPTESIGSFRYFPNK
jgi:hypothetical protein